MKPTTINLVQLFHDGAQVLSDGHAAKETAAAGNLRAGAGGAILDDGSVVGGCHRKAFARWIGQPHTTPDPGKQSNFDAGFRNEDNWEEKLKLSWPGTILKEEEIPTRWLTAGGVPVTGRPDMVLCKERPMLSKDQLDSLKPIPREKREEMLAIMEMTISEPQLVIEHKAVVSLNAAAKRWLGEVDPAHFIQSCHYSMALGVPATLVYSSSVIGMLPFFIKKVDREKFWPKGKGWQVQPFKKEFKIGMDPTTGCYYYVDSAGKITMTGLQQEHIKNYYELLVDMRDSKDLYKRHSNKNLAGELLPYNTCDYCDLKTTCDEFEGNFELWSDNIKKGTTDE